MAVDMFFSSGRLEVKTSNLRIFTLEGMSIYQQAHLDEVAWTFGRSGVPIYGKGMWVSILSL